MADHDDDKRGDGSKPRVVKRPDAGLEEPRKE